MLPALFLLTGDGDPATATCPGIGVGSLPATGQFAFVTGTAITANFHQTFHIKA
jgi:hypothetical protein